MMTRAAACLATTMALTSTAAMAADFATKAPRATEPTMWTGFYAGLNAGGAWAREHTSLALDQNNGSSTPSNDILAAAGTTRFSPSSLAGGGQLGFNYQFAPQFVGGIEADWSYLAMSVTRDTAPIMRLPDPAADLHDSIRIRSLATLHARLGVLASPQLLLFATGGVAVADIGYSDRIHFVQVPDTAINQGSVSGWRTGPVAGVGAEYAFAAHWTARIEYLYSTFKSPSFVSANTFDPRYQLQHGLDSNVSIGRFGVNYRF